MKSAKYSDDVCKLRKQTRLPCTNCVCYDYCKENNILGYKRIVEKELREQRERKERAENAVKTNRDCFGRIIYTPEEVSVMLDKKLTARQAAEKIGKTIAIVKNFRFKSDEWNKK